MVAEMMRLRAGQLAEPAPLPTHLDLTYSVSDAAKVLHCRRDRVNRLVSQGTLRAVRLAGDLRVSKDDVHALAEKLGRTSPPAGLTETDVTRLLSRALRQLADALDGMLTDATAYGPASALHGAGGAPAPATATDSGGAAVPYATSAGVGPRGPVTTERH